MYNIVYLVKLIKINAIFVDSFSLAKTKFTLLFTQLINVPRCEHNIVIVIIGSLLAHTRNDQET